MRQQGPSQMKKKQTNNNSYMYDSYNIKQHVLILLLMHAWHLWH